MQREEYNREDFEDSIVSIRKVTKVVKGGRRFRFRALVVIGDHNGSVGFGIGKAKEVPDAVAKAIDDAFKNVVTVQLKGSTISHDIEEKYNASRVLLKPASEGTGVIAGGAARHVLEAVGVKDILTKSLGSNNPYNLVRATVNALSRIKNRSGQKNRDKDERENIDKTRKYTPNNTKRENIKQENIKQENAKRENTNQDNRHNIRSDNESKHA